MKKAPRKKLFFGLLYLFGLCAGFTFSLFNRSQNPKFLGRYSLAFGIFLLSYGALIFSGLAVFFTRKTNNLRLIVPHVRRRAAWNFFGFLLLLFFIVLQMSASVQWAALCLPLILGAFLLHCAILPTGPRFLSFLLWLERVFASPWLSRAMVSMLSFILSLFFLEAFFRLFEPNLIRTSYYIRDHEIGFRLHSDTPGTNTLGFRDRDHPLQKPEGVYRIVALGDSFAFGNVLYEDNYLTLLEPLLSNTHNRSVEIINTGIPSYGPKEELRLLEKVGLKFSPDHVMLHFFIGNDFSDNDPLYKDKIALNGMVFNVRKFPIGTFLFRYSFLRHYFTVGRMALSRPRREPGQLLPSESGMEPKPQEAGKRDRSAEKLCEYFSAEEFDRIINASARLYSRSNISGLQTQFNYVRSLLLQMKTAAENGGAGFSIALLPDQLQADEVIRGKLAGNKAWIKHEFDFEAPNRLLDDFGKKNGIPILDLLPYFQKECRTEKMYINRNTHWNEKGNRLAAEAIADLWHANNLGPRSH